MLKPVKLASLILNLLNTVKIFSSYFIRIWLRPWADGIGDWHETFTH